MCWFWADDGEVIERKHYGKSLAELELENGDALVVTRQTANDR